ncbi:MAG: capsular polysaccharide biosynthesis protein CapF [Rhizobacter sp.]|nr:capsular polysaccharide biosynthesis protein CapF [Rhizobacter sp.]
MQIVLTGADGFIGRNLRVRLGELGHTNVSPVTSATTADQLEGLLSTADFVFHLAGVNRPKDPSEYMTGNTGFTRTLAAGLRATGRLIPIAFASSIQATQDNPYGASKLAAEDVLLEYGRDTGAPVYLARLANVFGKWCRPNYNSAVATFCHNIARGLPIMINDPSAALRLVYIDDVVEAFTNLLVAGHHVARYVEVSPVHETTVGQVATLLQNFAESRNSLVMPPVGTGLVRALYSTFISYLPPDAFAYEVPKHADPRGVFVEMLKTSDCGQFSYFTAHPGVTRGEHYHHSKTEKFLVIRGSAQFGFRHIQTGETHSVVTHGGEGRIVETVPGWTHNVTNVGEDELIVMLWANEIFDRQRPDTIAMKVKT